MTVQESENSKPHNKKTAAWATGAASGSARNRHQHFFTHPAYLDLCGCKDIRPVTITGPASQREHLFCHEKYPRHLGRLETLDANDIGELSSSLFSNPDTNFYQLEDVVLAKSELAKIPQNFVAFSYQTNWTIQLSEEGAGLSSKSLQELRRRHRRLTEQLGEEPKFVFRKCTKEDVALLTQHIELRFRERGKKFHQNKRSRAIMDEVCSHIGFFGGYFHKDRFISGDIVYIVGQRAYGILTAYDSGFGRFSPGLISHKRIIEQLRSDGITELNMLWGDGDYKARLGAKPQPLKTLFIARNRLAFLSPAFLAASAPYLKKELLNTVKNILRR